MLIYAVERYRTDTTKEGSEKILALYASEAECEKHVKNLNLLYEADPYFVCRARVAIMFLNEVFNDVQFQQGG